MLPLGYNDAWKIYNTRAFQVTYTDNLIELRFYVSEGAYHLNFGITTGDKIKFYFYDGITDALLWECD